MNQEEKRGNKRQKSFHHDIAKIEKRRIKERHDTHKEIWFGLGMMGIIGWSVSIPTLIGLFIGYWIDSGTEGSISWTLSGVIAGVIGGSLIAWYWIQNEQKKNEDENE